MLGLSGGIDSALHGRAGGGGARAGTRPLRLDAVALLVRGTRGDAQRLADNLGCDFRELSIGPVVDAYDQVLAEPFAGVEADLTEENLQARARGVILMALSNKFGWLVIATGNKSELSVGYATLYGDMAGGFALLKDVYKTDVWRLARYLNERAQRRSSRRRSSSARRAPSCATTSSTRIRSHPIPSWTRCSRPTWRRIARATS